MKTAYKTPSLESLKKMAASFGINTKGLDKAEIKTRVNDALARTFATR